MVRISSGESFPPGMYKTPVNTLDIYHISLVEGFGFRIHQQKKLGFEQFWWKTTWSVLTVLKEEPDKSKKNGNFLWV